MMAFILLSVIISLVLGILTVSVDVNPEFAGIVREGWAIIQGIHNGV